MAQNINTPILQLGCKNLAAISKCKFQVPYFVFLVGKEVASVTRKRRRVDRSGNDVAVTLVHHGRMVGLDDIRKRHAERMMKKNVLRKRAVSEEEVEERLERMGRFPRCNSLDLIATHVNWPIGWSSGKYLMSVPLLSTALEVLIPCTGT